MDPYFAEIRMFAGNYAPYGWMFCDGQLLSITEYTALYAIIGTMYGGDGVTTFALPDLRGRMPIHKSPAFESVGAKGGAEQVALTATQLPQHTHSVNALDVRAMDQSPQDNLIATPTEDRFVGGSMQLNASFDQQSVKMTGESQAHENMPPYTCVSFIISVDGYWPDRT